MKKSVFLCLVVMVVNASCSISKTVSSAYTLLPNTNITIADLDIQENKVTGEYRFDIQLDREKTVDKQELLNNAIYNALRPLKADVLVAAQYQIESSSRGNRMFYNVTVTGYPAYYRNFRSSDVKDVEFKEIGGLVYVIPKNASGEAVGYQSVVPSNKCSNLGTGIVEDKSSDLSKDKDVRMSSLDMLKMIYSKPKKESK